MVFVFGIDLPLVELIFVLTIVLILLFGLQIYLIVSQYLLNEKLKTVIRKEDVELKRLNTLNKEEKSELTLLRTIRHELDKLLYVKTHRKIITKKTITKKPAVKKRRKRVGFV